MAPLSWAQEFAGGDGTSGAPFQIGTWHHLNNIRDHLDAHFVLINDLGPTTSGYTTFVKDGTTLANNDRGWQPIGACESEHVCFRFNGVLDGNHHQIQGIEIARSSESEVGLFGLVGGNGTIENLRISGLKVTGNQITGGMVSSNNGTLSGVRVQGEVMGANGSTGGVVGANAGTLSEVSFYGSVTGGADTGGLVGRSGTTSSVSASYADAVVRGTTRVGGAIGINFGVVNHVFARGAVSGETDVGGLIGSTFRDLNETYSSASVSASNGVAGGLIGRLGNTTGDITISNSYATGMVSGNSDSRGLVGNATRTSDSGPFAVINSFWDVEQSGLGSVGPDDMGADGETTVDMTSFATFDAAWNSPTETVIVDGWQAPNNPSWGICELTNDGYPFLLWQFDSNPCLPDAPTAVTAVRGDGQATVSWTAPVGSGLTYTVTAMPGGLTCTTTSTSCVIDGLTNGTEYTFTVVANNSSGAGPTSALSVGVTPAGPPSAPLDIQVTASVNRLQVSWTAPLNNGGMPIVRYIARANPSCEVAALLNEVPGETLYSCELINLDPEQTYQVFVSAVTGAGETEAAALGGGSDNTPASFAPLPVIPVPVNNPWALMVLVLMMLGLVIMLNRRRSNGFARSRSNTRLVFNESQPF